MIIQYDAKTNVVKPVDTGCIEIKVGMCDMESLFNGKQYAQCTTGDLVVLEACRDLVYVKLAGKNILIGGAPFKVNEVYYLSRLLKFGDMTDLDQARIVWWATQGCVYTPYGDKVTTFLTSREYVIVRPDHRAYGNKPSDIRAEIRRAQALGCLVEVIGDKEYTSIQGGLLSEMGIYKLVSKLTCEPIKMKDNYFLVYPTNGHAHAAPNVTDRTIGWKHPNGKIYDSVIIYLKDGVRVHEYDNNVTVSRATARVSK